MSGVRSGAVRDDVVRLFQGDSVAGLDEGELLHRFATRRDEAAFEALVTKLGPMVLGVARRMLADPHDVEDAFQATFLVLVRKAGSIRDLDLVAPWLYGVALKVARRARAESTRRKARERLAAVPEGAEGGSEAGWPEVRAAIDEEIGRLPEAHRRAVVLCDVEGLSREEAAVRLGWTLNMVRGRLERARGRLRGRLARRGLAPSGAGIGLVIAPPIPSPALLAATVRAALAFSGGRLATSLANASAVALSQGVLRMMTLSKLKLAAVALLSAGFVAGGSGWIAAQGTGHEPRAAAKAVVADPATPKPAVAADPFRPRPAAELAKARVDAARQRFNVQVAFYKEGRITIDRISGASKGLMQTELDAATTKALRVEAVRAHHDRLAEILKAEEAELEVGRATSADVAEAKSGLLDAEFALAKELETPETTKEDRDAFTRALIEYQRGRRQMQEAYDQLSLMKAQAEPGPAAKPSEHVYKSFAIVGDGPLDLATLGKGRVEMARKLWETQRSSLQNNRTTIDRPLAASQALLEAELDATEQPFDRLGPIRAHVDRLKDLEEIELARHGAGRSSNGVVEEVQTQRLAAEFRFVQEMEAFNNRIKSAAQPPAGGPSPVADLERRLSDLEKKVERLINLIDPAKR